MAHEYSYRPLSSTRSTRVLLLQPNADHNAELCCVLEEISLDAAPIRRYNALSYVWGAKTGTRPLYSEGKTVLITPNCEKALRRLRHATKLVTLWVDAICINQRDLNERAKQVSLMGDVYRNAKEVVIWLGEGTKDTARCFSRMPISSQLLATRFTQVWSHLPLSLRRKADLFLSGGVTILDLTNICSNEWATRIWTVQELIFASKPVVMCGGSRIPWHIFWKFTTYALPHFVGQNPQDTTRFMASFDSLNARTACANLFLALEMSIPSDQATLVIALITSLSQTSKCSNPLDKIYAIYPLITRFIKDLPAVDYSRDENELLECFTLASIRSTQTFWPVLLNPWATEPLSRLPSWVPEMSPQTGYPTREMVHSQDNWKGKNATPSSLVDIPLLQDLKPGTIAFKGKIFTEVVAKGPRWPGREGNTLNKVLVLATWIMCSFNDEACVDLVERVISDFRDLLVAFMGLPSSRKVQKQFISLFKWCTKRPDLSATQETWKQWVTDDFNSDKDRIGLITSLTKSEGLILFQTAAGYLGMSYGYIEPGHTIALLAGSCFPVCLRKDAENWRYIGPAYIQGIMNGEAWPQDTNTDDLETFILI